MKLNLFKLEDSSNTILCTLSHGQHSLGRGEILNCNDKRISRNHISIVIELNTATLSLVHQTNPCYFRCADNKYLSLLQPNVPVSLKDNDTFGFFRDTHWYRIQVCHDTNENEPSSSSEGLNNAVVKDGLLSHPVSEALPVSGVDGSNVHSDPSQLSSTQNNIASGSVKTETEINEEIKKECDSTTKNGPENNLVNEQPSCSSGVATSTTPGTTKKEYRERCWYKDNCYRKNAEHTSKYSHRGDADYDTDPEDDRPLCPYGRNCYRRNNIHRRKYKHSTQATQTPGINLHRRPSDDTVDPANIIQNKRKRTKVKTKYESDNDSDLCDDPFAADDDSDEDYFDSDDE